MYDSTIEPPSLALLLGEATTLLELGDLFFATQQLDQAPCGDGHPVLVIPGFMVGDTSTIPLRHFLKSRGYAVHPWGLGINNGYFKSVLDQLAEELDQICADTDQKVSLIGWSLGGIYARELARAHPERVRQVITMGTPFARSLKASHIRKLYEWVTGNHADKVDPELFARLQEPPPVPTTAIYTKSDGIVAWQTTQEQIESDTVQNICVTGSHCGLGHNRQVLLIIADRLAQGPDAWQPFQLASLPSPSGADRSWQARSESLDQSLNWVEEWVSRRIETDDGNSEN